MPTHHCTHEPHRERGSVTVWPDLRRGRHDPDASGSPSTSPDELSLPALAQDVAAQAARIAGEQVNAPQKPYP